MTQSCSCAAPAQQPAPVSTVPSSARVVGGQKGGGEKRFQGGERAVPAQEGDEEGREGLCQILAPFPGQKALHGTCESNFAGADPSSPIGQVRA